MKTKILSLVVITTIVFGMSSCNKTYACECTPANSTATYTAGQVKAISKKRAEKLCSSTCTGGTVSVK